MSTLPACQRYRGGSPLTQVGKWLLKRCVCVFAHVCVIVSRKTKSRLTVVKTLTVISRYDSLHT